ncbi:glycosyltransferase family 2 protein [Pseudomonas knackmussii]|uniref:Glycosyltransferase family 2 protein n=1 Tax=Pseudomonas knackmussii TaxID=65741 RepID=A0ABY4KNK6_9PSED|nr:glycosyltransferase family 2 protein [Pseudomonas knackmussii]UPQ81328.1 glycosyltransferase family 2 protein [Pseudomonas knackmussii]
MLTVVIPSYNHESYIGECLAAASKIKLENLKILVIDDGSTDQTASLVKGFIEKNKAINIGLIEKKNSGLVSSLNLALQVVETEYIYICASDDVPDFIGVEKCYSILLRHKKLGFCIGGATNFNDQSGEISNTYGKQHIAFFSTDFSSNEDVLFLKYPAPLLLQSTVFKKSALIGIGGWDETLKWDDYPVFVKLLKKYKYGLDRDFVFVPDINVVRYRHHGNNTYSNVSNQFFMVQQAMSKLAGQRIKDKAIGMKAAYYMLLSIRNIEPKAFFEIFKQCSVSVKIKLPYYMGLYFFERISK